MSRYVRGPDVKDCAMMFGVIGCLSVDMWAGCKMSEGEVVWI